MAFASTQNTLFGVPATWFAIRRLLADIPAGTAEVTLAGFASEEAFNEGKDPLSNQSFIVPIGELNQERLVMLVSEVESHVLTQPPFTPLAPPEQEQGNPNPNDAENPGGEG